MGLTRKIQKKKYQKLIIKNGETSTVPTGLQHAFVPNIAVI